MRIAGLKLKTEVYKVKHFRCAAMKGKGARTRIRIIYAYLPGQRRIDFIEIYYKEKDDKDCDRERIRSITSRRVLPDWLKADSRAEG